MKYLLGILLLTALISGRAYPQETPPDILLGIGFLGIAGGDAPFGYSFAFGVKKPEVGFLASMTYAEKDAIRRAGLSTQVLFRLGGSFYASAGPEIQVRALGLVELGGIGELHYAFGEPFYFSVGYSDIGKLNTGLIFSF